MPPFRKNMSRNIENNPPRNQQRWSVGRGFKENFAFFVVPLCFLIILKCKESRCIIGEKSRKSE